jgi:hypothetical protein
MINNNSTGTALTNADFDDSLTLDGLMGLYRDLQALRPKPLYYVADDRTNIVDEDGKPCFYLVNETRFHPELVVVHPHNLAALVEKKSNLGDRQLIPLSEWEPSEEEKRRMFTPDIPMEIESAGFWGDDDNYNLRVRTYLPKLWRRG